MSRMQTRSFQMRFLTPAFLGNAKAHAPKLAQRLTRLTMQHQPEGKRIEWLRNFISVAEFFAREVRSTPEQTA